MADRRPNPDNLNGVPVCSRDKCPLFRSYTQSGWGVQEQCYAWDRKNYGPTLYSLMSPSLCRPYCDLVLKEAREAREALDG